MPDDPLSADPLGELARGGITARRDPLPPPVRELHRAVLRAFLAAGVPPHRDDLHPQAAALGVDLDDALRCLSRADLIHTDTDGRVAVAYPFSGRPTGHTVTLDGGPTVAAMCAIDALGIPLMSGRDALITSTDPNRQHPIRVERRGGRWRWEPTAVVLLAHTGDGGSSADCLCPTITFHPDADAAAAHLDGRPELTGVVLAPHDAVELARLSFAALLDPDTEETLS